MAPSTRQPDAPASPGTESTPPTEPVKVALIIGSTRVDRFGTVPAGWAAARARDRHDVVLDVVDLADTPLPTVFPGDDPDTPLPEAVTALARRIEWADAVVIVTPVYNRGYPASLKNAIDWIHGEWNATPVGFVCYGGRTGGIEAVEQLRTVFVELGTMTIRSVLSFPDCRECFDESGTPRDAGAHAAATEFYDELTWWARALRAARKETAG
ncbi:NAD(P)H-dependent FMN reductase [Stackebrandtia albiflava]|uniref:NAD(P)H-dependent FMN reductase n=1 Tax=Stackebrandtia albiflava TaxID=406432 RepID=A0A562VC52_9ACTN|nr:NAD(P)H-dependent oxidoreductase [Stackebrandtia albiflava]TWJ15465.1 NAD(P)H-dependent FMN reductase [Stackebrandtia albiflava]